MKDEASEPRAGQPPASEPVRRVNPDTEQLAAQMSALLADLVRTPEAELATGWVPSLRAGEPLGRFTLKRELGRGGMGVVWEAEDPALGRTVAVKLVKPGHKAAGRGEAWLRREAEAVARLNHPNIVTLYDLGAAEAGTYLVFELLRGRPLDERLQDGPLPLSSVLAIGVEVARALVHAHGQGVIHRDLKPANVFAADDGAVKVLDFGLAHLLGRTGSQEGGTRAFMAPEQWRGEAGDERTDLFALGVVLHLALSGDLPYPLVEGRSAVERPGATPLLPASLGPARLRRLVARCLERDPAARPATAAEVLAELRAIQAAQEGRWRRRTQAALVAVAVTASLGAGWQWWNKEPPPGERLQVVVADVDNQAGDAAMDGLAPLLVAALEPSRRLDLMPRTRLLRLAREAGMGDLPRLDARAAGELARVAGVPVLLATAARREGRGVLVEVRATDPSANRPLFTVAESAASTAEVAGVLDGLADKVRRKLRERRDDLAAGPTSVARAISPSLEAARLYYQGVDCELRPAALGKTAVVDCTDFYREALKRDPAFPLAHYRLAWMAVATGEAGSEGQDHLASALRAVDRLSWRDGLQVRALADRAAGRTDDALRKLEELLARYPEDRDALLDVASIHVARRALLSSLPYWERALAADPGSETALGGVVEVLGSLGRRAELGSLVERARALPKTPDRTEAIVRGLVWLGRGEEALQTARAAAEAGGGAPAMSLVASTLIITGRLEEAERVQRQRIAEVPSRAPSRWSLALVLAGQGRLHEALRTVDEAEAIGSTYGETDHRIVRAAVVGAAGRPEPVWREVSRFALTDARFASTLSVLLALLGDVVHAEQVGAALPPEDLTRAQLQALLAWRRGDPTAALSQLAVLEQRDPWNYDGMLPAFLATEVAAAAGDHREVLAAARRFERLWPTGYWYGWGAARVRLHVARAHLALGDLTAARTEADALLMRLKRGDPDFPLLREARALRARL